jgi:GNAT superfamily N-acetyltransferase
MNAPLTIGPVGEPDLERLAILLQELSGQPTDLQAMHRNFHAIKDREDYRLVGAWIDGELVGSLLGILCTDLVGDGRPFMVLENVVVSRSHHRRGIGRALLEHIEAQCRRDRCSYAMFVSGAQRTEAHAFYESIGYGTDAVQGFKKVFTPMDFQG